jgi:ribosomal protein S18 acetylase RimI-like enzyme
MEQARVATASDLPTLRMLSEMAVAETSRQRGGALLVAPFVDAGPSEELLASMVSDDDRLLVVGTTDGVEVGFAVARCDRARQIGVIEAIYVEPPARQVGVGEAMVDLIVGWCEARQCAGVDAPALPGSRSAKAFFEGHGFVARLLVMHHPIRQPHD